MDSVGKKKSHNHCRQHGMWPAAHAQSKASPFEMNAVNKKTVHGPPVQSIVAAAYRAVPAACAMILTQHTKRCMGCQCSPVMRLPTGQSLQHAR